jgi:hypothetical protein
MSFSMFAACAGACSEANNTKSSAFARNLELNMP